MTSNNDIAVSLENICVRFKYRPKTTLKKTLLSILKPDHSALVTSDVLSDLSLEIKKGETFGIIGKNGAGKTTLGRVIAGILKPQKGTINVNGCILPLFGVGVGFDYELTGRENIELHADFYRQDADCVRNIKAPKIIEYADIGKYIDAPLKYYSSGMLVRLGFAIAIHFDFDILILDEVLQVGDADFAKKCERSIQQIKDSEKTLIIISHNMDKIQELCDRVLYLKHAATNHAVAEASVSVRHYISESD